MALNVHLMRYLWEVRGELPGSRKQRKQILSRVESSVRDFVTEHPGADYAAIAQRFGTPQQIAMSYIEEMGAPELRRELRIKKRIVCIAGATALAVVLLWAGFVLAVFIDSHKSINGYGRYGEVTVIESIENEGVDTHEER